MFIPNFSLQTTVISEHYNIGYKANSLTWIIYYANRGPNPSDETF